MICLSSYTDVIYFTDASGKQYILPFMLQFDPEGFGEIPWSDFLQTLQHPDFIAQVPAHKREVSSISLESLLSSALNAVRSCINNTVI